MDDALKLSEKQNDSEESQTTQNMNLSQSKTKLPTETANTIVDASAARCYGGGGCDTKLRSSNPKQHAVGPSSSTMIGYVIRNNASAQKRGQNDPSPITEHHKSREKFQNNQKSRSKKLEVPEEKTNDKATQTDEEYHQTPLEKIDAIINVLSAKLDRLKTQTQILDSQVASKRQQNCSSSKKAINNDTSHLGSDRNATSNSSSNNLLSEYSDEDNEYKTSKGDKNNEQETSTGLLCKVTDTPPTMVPIGEGNAVVPSSVLRMINWSSYSYATRSLMLAVFSKKVIATSSLTGKPPQCDPFRTPKKKLNPAVVDDIVQTVVERCNVTEPVVRKIMSLTCSYEGRMLNRKRTPLKNNSPSHSLGSAESSDNTQN